LRCLCFLFRFCSLSQLLFLASFFVFFNALFVAFSGLGFVFLFFFFASLSLSFSEYGLSEDQSQIYTVAMDFAKEKMASQAEKWDQEEIFPVETLREAAELGFGAVYVSPDFGGSGLGRLDAALIFEALSTGCVSTTAYISIHKLVNRKTNICFYSVND